MELLELKNICKSYLNTKILTDISLQVKSEEFISIIGASGSGKSTLLYIIGGIELPNSGKVFLSGCDFNKLSDRKKSMIRQNDIGFVFQFYNLVHNLTIEDNIMLPAIMSGRKRKDVLNKLIDLLEIFDLSDHRYKIPSQLSGGQQQRVSIVRAVINNPKLILADEPTGNLDSNSSTIAMEMLTKINKEFKTSIIHVTHNPDLINYSNRIIKIKDGKILSDVLNIN